MHQMNPDQGAIVRSRSSTPLSTLIYYGAGEAATSLVLNGLNGFALLYYTDALGLSAKYAGLALSISLFWEAVTEPLMGHISDRTRSRLGSRYPWIIAGGMFMAITFYFLWAVPVGFRGGGSLSFSYLLCLNLILRTTLSMFIIPYVALGFEIAPAYDDRPRLQSVRWVCNMAANFAGPALAWTIFFQDRLDSRGKSIVGTSVASNYTNMGAWFAISVVLLTAAMLWGCRHSLENADDAPPEHQESIGGHLLSSFLPIFRDANARRILICVFVLVLGMVITSSVQAYLYVHLLHLSGVQRTIVHASTMVASALGAAISPMLVTRFDKRGSIIFGCWCGIIGKSALLLGLYGFGYNSGSVSAIVFFASFDAVYWMASGIVMPVATAMIGDLGNIAGRKAGRSLDGSYSGVLSLAWRVGVSVSLLVSGAIISAVGYDTSSGSVPSTGTMAHMAEVSFIAAAAMYGLAALTIRRYSLNKLSFELQS